MASKNDEEDIVKQIRNAFKKGSSLTKNNKVTKKKYSQSSSTKNKKITKKSFNIPQDESYVSGIEIYKTKDKNIEKTSKNEEKQGFVLQNGEITEVAYYNEIISDSYEADYEDISTNASVNLVRVDGTRFYKGKKLALKKAYNPRKWSDLKQVHLGFITEQSYSEDGVELKISGMSKLLDQEKQFTFTKTKISKVLKEIIESTGLKAKIDTTGLKDSKISYTNVSSSGNSSSDVSSTGSATIDETVQKAITGKNDALSKAKAIDSAFKTHVFYKYYFNCKFSDIDKAWKNGHLNCADGANVLCAMFISAGLNAVIHHTPGADGRGHYIVIVKINGKNYATDNAASTGSHTTRAFGSTWGPSSGSKVGTKISM